MLWGGKEDLPFLEAQTLGLVDANERRAIELLKKVVPYSLYARYLLTGNLIALGQVSGNFYIIQKNDGVVVLDDIGTPTHYYCIHSSYGSHIPSSDDVISLWLVIQLNENQFLTTANKSEYRGCGFELDWEDICAEKKIIDLTDQLDVIIIEEYNPIPMFDDYVNNDLSHVLECPSWQNWSIYRDRYDYFLPRLERISYQLGFHEAAEFSERTRQISIPTLNCEGKWITQGLANLCLRLRLVDEPPMYQTVDGLVYVSLVDWRSTREFDDTFLLQLLTAYTKLRHDGVINDRSPPNPTNRFTKCIMSFRVYRDLVGEPTYLAGHPVPMEWNGLTVMIDDRVGSFVFCLPDARHLGVICRDYSEPMLAGLTILEQDNVFIYQYYGGEVHPLSLEMGMESTYSLFPDRNPIAIEYDILQFERSAEFRWRAPTEDVIEAVRNHDLEWRGYPLGFIGNYPLPDRTEDDEWPVESGISHERNSELRKIVRNSDSQWNCLNLGGGFSDGILGPETGETPWIL